MADPLSERVAGLALEIFSKLPQRCKPRTLADGRREWTPMSAIALSRQADPSAVKIVSLATGTKSLPVSALTKCKGLVLHDSHAEILALRGLNYWLLTEMQRVLDRASHVSEWLEHDSHPVNSPSQFQASKRKAFPFRIRKGVEISLFSTEAPCGDASMELVMSATETAGRDITPWSKSASDQSDDAVNLPLGRGFFSNLGALRRKPARADAEVSMSKSCTDKLMLKQLTSLLAFPLDLFLDDTEETFLKRMIVYSDCWNEKSYDRAFTANGRLAKASVAMEPDSLVRMTFFDVETLPERFGRFDFERSTGSEEDRKVRASNISALWIAGAIENEAKNATDLVEVLLNGVRQGFKQFDDRDRKGSVVCKRNMLEKASRLDAQLSKADDAPLRIPRIGDQYLAYYSELKSLSVHSRKTLLKRQLLHALGGWPKKDYDDDFAFSILSSEPYTCPIHCSNSL